MTRDGRLVLTGHMGAAMNMAVDEALTRLSPLPAFRYYGWDPAAVSIGYFQRIQREIDLQATQSMGVDVVRRITGGGAVYHDTLGEVTYSFSVPEEGYGIPKDINESYAMLCGGIVSALAELGVQTRFSPINDIIHGERKISGNAQTRRGGKVLQHGTLLLRVDPERMFSLLKVPDEKMKDKMIKAVKERVTSMELANAPTDFATVGEALVRGFSSTTGIRFSPSELTSEEKELAQRLSMDKYSSGEWNHRR